MLARLQTEPTALWRGLQNDMDNILSLKANHNDKSREWMPSMDVIEEDQQFVFRADVPGIDPKDIQILIEEGTLILKGERADQREQEHKGYRRLERMYGSFQRSFRLPDSIDADNISASSRHGVLEVRVPKQEKLSRKIEIQSE